METFILNSLILIASLYFLVVAAKWMLDGAINIAQKAGLSPLIIGSTIVAFGTILPSVAVNLVILVFSPEQMEIAVGNMLGTNYVNLGLALGLPAFITNIVTKYQVFEKEIPLYLSLLALFTVFGFDMNISPFEGFMILVAYIAVSFIIYQYASRERTETKVKMSEVDAKLEVKSSQTKSILLIVVGLIALVASAIALVYSAPVVASYLGISSYIVGLTVVGVGTSLPTIVASIEAAKRNDIDIILGNVFGGNIINIGLGAGLPAIFHNIPLTGEAVSDLYFTTIFNFVILICILAEMKLLGEHKTLSKVSGGIIVAMYLGYIILKIVQA
jgi:cation:H+ antiporter